MQFTKTKLSLAVIASFASLSYATEQTANLDLIKVVSENSGAKVETSVVTLDEINKSTATDLRGILRAEPSIELNHQLILVVEQEHLNG